MNAYDSLQYFYPEIIIIITGLIIILLDLFINNKRILAYLSILGLGISLIFMSVYIVPKELFYGMIVIDPFAVFFKIISVLVMMFIILISMDYRFLMKKYSGEYYSLLLFMTFGMMLMASSTNLLMILLSIELVNLTSYLLVAFNKNDAKSSEAALKFFLIGTIATAIMLYGMTLIFGITGSIDIKEIYLFFSDGTADTLEVLLFLLMILAGFGFKISMVPFHWWTPDVYEGAPTPITAFLSVGSKAVGFAVLFRTFLMAFPSLHSDWSNILGLLAVVTMTLGNIIALTQNNIKRLLAYSSIAHAGYILVPISIGYTAWAKEAILIYILTYYLMNLGVFSIIIIIGNALNSYELNDYSGLYKRAPYLAAALAIFMLSLTGLPPLAGFYGKYYIFIAILDAGQYYYWLALAVAINSALAAYYYFRIIRQMYLVEPDENTRIYQPLTLQIALAFTVIPTITISFFLGYILDFIRQSIIMVSWI